MTDILISARDCWTRLGIGKTAFYAIPFFRSRKYYPTPGAVRYRESDLALYQRTCRQAA